MAAVNMVEAAAAVEAEVMAAGADWLAWEAEVEEAKAEVKFVKRAQVKVVHRGAKMLANRNRVQVA